ncbi:MAG: hypothetical protein KGL39_40835 [Patescibacteria group bacterium]|nr:hypothetical protein [Patescibacteria group bacterium]
MSSESLKLLNSIAPCFIPDCGACKSRAEEIDAFVNAKLEAAAKEIEGERYMQDQPYVAPFRALAASHVRKMKA